MVICFIQNRCNKKVLIALIFSFLSSKQGPRTPPSPSQQKSSPASPRDNRKRIRTPTREHGDPIGYGTPPKRTRKDRSTMSPNGRDRDYRESSRGKNSRDRDYRDNDRRTRSPR